MASMAYMPSIDYEENFIDDAQSSVSFDDIPLAPGMEYVIMESPSPRQRASNGFGTAERDLTAGVKRLVESVRQLRAKGVESEGLPLPKIVVVGDQSTGKSSLIEGLSEIKVPRADDTCTRCPLEINLAENTTDEGWSCVISLVKKFKYDDEVDHENVADRPFGPWVKLDEQETVLFHRLSDKSKIQHAIFCAQAATLNPKVYYKDFVPRDDEPLQPDLLKYQTEFSPNVIRLDICGPGLPNLSFYDLPGIENDEEDGKHYLLEILRNLVTVYIQQKNCLILLTLSMTADAKNSTTANLVKTLNAQNRTLGVLTKPDRVDANSLLQWEQRLKGERGYLAYGYFIVRNHPDVNMNYREARIDEAYFFANTEPYCGTMAEFKHRFGILKLRKRLSKLLTEQIRKCIPSIREKVEVRINHISETLGQFPEQPLNPLMVVISKLVEFRTKCHQHIDGGSGEFPLRFEWEALIQRFLRSLESSSPSVKITDDSPFPQADTESVDKYAQNFTADEQQATPSRRRNKDVGRCDQEPQTPNRRKRALSQAPLVTPKRQRQWQISESVQGIAFTLPQVKRIAQETSVVNFDYQVDSKAIERMIKMSIQHWRQVGLEFVDQTSEMLSDTILKLFGEIFNPYRETPLYEYILNNVKDFLNKSLLRQKEAVEREFNMDNEKPAVRDSKGLNKEKVYILGELLSKRREIRIRKFLESTEGLNPNKTKVSDAELGEDPYFKQLDAISFVLAFYRKVSFRFVENISRSVETVLFKTCRDDLFSELEGKLELKAADANIRCTELMTETPEKKVLRAELEKELEKLKSAQKSLDELCYTPFGNNEYFFAQA